MHTTVPYTLLHVIEVLFTKSNNSYYNIFIRIRNDTDVDYHYSKHIFIRAQRGVYYFSQNFYKERKLGREEKGGTGRGEEREEETEGRRGGRKEEREGRREAEMEGNNVHSFN